MPKSGSCYSYIQAKPSPAVESEQQTKNQASTRLDRTLSFSLLLCSLESRKPGRQDRDRNPRRRWRRHPQAAHLRRRRAARPSPRRQAPPPGTPVLRLPRRKPPPPPQPRPAVRGGGRGEEAAGLAHPDQARGLPPQGLVARPRGRRHLRHHPRRRRRPRPRPPREDRRRGTQVRGRRYRGVRLQLRQARW
uniref:Uncharacterized protein n=1 Tax=Leersia perrieri TaxID=77586 RepID=A0A0D9WAT0_9ORYZ